MAYAGRGNQRGNQAPLPQQYHDAEDQARQQRQQEDIQGAINNFLHANNLRRREARRRGNDDPGHQQARAVNNQQVRQLRAQRDEQEEIARGPVGAYGQQPNQRPAQNQWERGGRGGLAARLGGGPPVNFNNGFFPPLPQQAPAIPNNPVAQQAWGRGVPVVPPIPQQGAAVPVAHQAPPQLPQGVAQIAHQAPPPQAPRVAVGDPPRVPAGRGRGVMQLLPAPANHGRVAAANLQGGQVRPDRDRGQRGRR